MGDRGSDQRIGGGLGGGNGGAGVAWAVLVYDEVDGEQHAARGGAHARDAGREETNQVSAERPRHIANILISPARHVTINCEAELHDRRHYRDGALPSG